MILAWLWQSLSTTIQSILSSLLSLVPPPPSGWVSALHAATDYGNVLENMGHWLPVNLLYGISVIYLPFWGIAMAIVTVRRLISNFTGGGGAI